MAKRGIPSWLHTHYHTVSATFYVITLNRTNSWRW